MPLGPGTRLGPYEVLSALGAGGMGEVYKARDTRLDRDVAIKILPETLAADPHFRERFDREARTISQLDHPNICALYDVGEQTGTAYLVMQYLEGETLEQRLKKGALPLDQALGYAIQIADALNKAHRAGIVHRDLKPGNIMLTKSGAKLLDFGLAKAGSQSTVAAGLSMLPTTPPNLTAQGTILGTFQYMAPEQLEGAEADPRTDIFAFGALVYEMLTGRKAFEGKSQASLISAIMSADPPPISNLQPLTPLALDRVVLKCLAKDPDRRWQSARDLHDELTWVVEGGTRTGADSAATASAVEPWGWERMVSWTTAAIFAITAIVLGVLYLRVAPVAHPELIRFTIFPPPNVTMGSTTGKATPALSPDGRRLAFIASGGGSNNTRDALWVRSLEGLIAQPIEGTNAATDPFWSPNGKTLAFFDVSDAMLKSVDATGGPVRSICHLPAVPRGGTWSRDGVILFGSTAGAGLFKVSSNGGDPTRVTSPNLARGETAHRFPVFLPDGRRFLYVSAPSNTIWMGSLDSKDTTSLTSADSQVMYVEPGTLLFVRQGTLMAQSFDAERGRLTGDPAPIAQQVLLSGVGGGSGGEAAFAASNTGVVVYRTGSGGSTTQLTWVDRGGNPLAIVGPAGPYRNPVLSPDGTRIAMESVDARGRSDIWVMDLAHNVPTRLTFDPDTEMYPIWSPDSSRIIFGSDRDGGAMRLYQKRANGIGGEEQVLKGDVRGAPYSWSPDGRYVVYRRNAGGVSTLGLLPLEGERTPNAFDDLKEQRVYAQISPDGKWLAYQSAAQMYVESFPAPGGGKWQIGDGAQMMRWRGDGKELFYLARDGRLMAVSVVSGLTPQFGVPVPLFEPRLLAFGPSVRQQYDVASDGQRFLINMPVEDPAAAAITVVLNWSEELKQRVPTR
jgi:eukaryotic-like serine/threonine-protein kinase